MKYIINHPNILFVIYVVMKRISKKNKLVKKVK